MAVGFVASATSGSQASVATFNIGTLGTGARAGIVFVCIHNSSTDIITGVTWNGTSMNLLYKATDTDTEPGVTKAYFLDNVTNGVITVSRTNNTVITVGYAASISASYAAYVAQTITRVSSTQNTNADTSTSGTGASGEVSVDDGSPGTSSMRFAAAFTGAATPLGAGTNSTSLHTLDSTAYGSSFVRETTAGQGSRSVGFATGTTDDYAAVFVAVSEAAPKTITVGLLDGSAAIYAPTVSPDQFLTVGLLDGSAAIYQPTVTGLTGAKTLTLPLLSAVPRSYADTVLGSGPVAYWRLGEPSGTTADNATGNATLDGTYVDTPTLGVTGAVRGSDTAVSFNGTSECVTVPDDDAFPADVFTYEAWISRGSTGANRTIMSKGYQAGCLRVGTSGYLSLTKSGVSDIVQSTALVPTGWHHVVATKDGATVKLYLDAVDVTGTVTNATCINGNDAFSIGAESGGVSEFSNGTIDEVAVYARALSAAEVAEHYVAGSKYADAVKSDGPVSYWRLGDAGSTAVDAMGVNNGTYYGDITKGVAGALADDSDTAATFPGEAGSDDAVQIASPTGIPVGSSLRSVEAWFKSTWRDNGRIVAYGDGTSTNTEFGLMLDMNGTDNRIVVAFGEQTSNYYGWWHNFGLADGNWHHVVVVMESTTSLRCYVDGSDSMPEDSNPKTMAVQNTLLNSNGVMIGSDSRYGIGSWFNTFNGQIDEVAIYNYSLTATQVREHYLIGASARLQIPPIALAPKSTLTLPLIGANDDYATAILAETDLLAYWRLGETSGAMEDSKGNDDLTLVGGSPTRGIAGALTGSGNGALLQGGSYGLSSGAISPWAGDFTVEGWARMDATGYRAFASTEATTEGFRLGSGYQSWSFWTSENGGNIYISAPTAANLGEWYHVAVTRSGSLFTLYVNGVSVNSSSGTYVNPSGGGFWLGVSGNDWLYGVDEIAVYDAALSAATLLAHYDIGRGLYAPTLQIVSSGPQDITVPLLDGGSAIYAPTVKFTLAVPLIDASAAIYAPAVYFTLAVPLINAGSAIYAPSVKFTLAVPLIDGVAAIYQPTLTPKNLLSLGLTDAGAAIYAITLTPKNLLSVGLIDGGAALYAPTVSPDQFVDVPLLDGSSAIYAVTVVAVALTATLPLLDAGAAIYDLTVLPQPVTVTLTALLDGGAAIYDVTVVAGPLSIAPPLLDGGTTLYAPTLVGKNTLSPGLIDGGAALYAPTVMRAQFLTPPLLDGGAAQYAPTLTQGPARIALPLIDGVADIYEVTVLSGTNTIAPQLLDAGAAIYAITLTVAPITFDLTLLDGLAEVYGVTITLAPWPMVVPLLDGGASVFTPTLNRYNALLLPDLTSVSALYDPTLTVGPVTLDIGLIDAVSMVFSLYVLASDYAKADQFMRQAGVRGRGADATMTQKR